jgi:heme/copper-type cytochrome/quinol oxidase subunit 1
MNQFITIAAICFAVQVLFVINFFYSIWYGKKQTDQEPMGRYYPGMDYANRAGPRQLARQDSYGTALVIRLR